MRAFGEIVWRKKLVLLVMGLLLAGTLASCAPRIYGARPHRRDRHCGCEYVQPQVETPDCARS